MKTILLILGLFLSIGILLIMFLSCEEVHLYLMNNPSGDINVQSFGIMGDSSITPRDTFNACYDSAGINYIYFPEGDYVIDGQRTNCNWQTIKIRGDGINKTKIYLTEGGLFMHAGSNTTVKNLSLYHSNTRGDGEAIYMRNASPYGDIENVLIENLYIKSDSQRALLICYCVNSTVKNCKLEGIDATIEICGGSNNLVENNEIIQTATLANIGGIVIADDYSIVRNNIIYAKFHAIDIEGGNYNLIDSNLIYQDNLSALYDRNSHNNTFIKNICYGNNYASNEHLGIYCRTTNRGKDSIWGGNYYADNEFYDFHYGAKLQSNRHHTKSQWLSINIDSNLFKDCYNGLWIESLDVPIKDSMMIVYFINNEFQNTQDINIFDNGVLNIYVKDNISLNRQGTRQYFAKCSNDSATKQFIDNYDLYSPAQYCVLDEGEGNTIIVDGFYY